MIKYQCSTKAEQNRKNEEAHRYNKVLLELLERFHLKDIDLSTKGRSYKSHPIIKLRDERISWKYEHFVSINSMMKQKIAHHHKSFPSLCGCAKAPKANEKKRIICPNAHIPPLQNFQLQYKRRWLDKCNAWLENNLFSGIRDLVKFCQLQKRVACTIQQEVTWKFKGDSVN